MNVRVMKKSQIQQKKKSYPRKPQKKRTTFEGPTKKWCKPKLIYSIDGKSILTSSKWYPKPLTCVFDWLNRGFVVVTDEKVGGGFDFRDFPDISLKEIADYNKKKLNIKD